MTKLKTFNKDLTWEDLHSNNFTKERDYDYQYTFSLPGVIDTKKVSLIHKYCIKGLELLVCSGFCYKEWSDGELLDCKIYDLRGVAFVPDFECETFGLLADKKRISGISFFKKKHATSRFFKKISLHKAKESSNSKIQNPKFIFFASNDSDVLKCHLNESRVVLEKYFSLKIPISWDESDFLRFRAFLTALNERILIAEEYNRVSRELDILDCPLQEQEGEIQVFKSDLITNDEVME